MRLVPAFSALAAAGLVATLAAPASAQMMLDELTSSMIAGTSLTERVWQRTDTPDLPGSMQLFLSDGTLLSTSCWEGYRLSSWRMTGEDTLSWDEDGITIPATIVEIDEVSLVLDLTLVSGEILTQTFEVAPVPFVCPDMPR